MLPASRPRNGRLVQRVRPRHLPRLHDLQPRRDPLPGPLGPGERRRPRRPERPAPLVEPAGHRHDDADRDQRRHLPARARAGGADLRQRRLDLRVGRAQRHGGRARGLVPPALGRLPPLRPGSPRPEHARALVDRSAARGLSRPGPLPPALPRLRPRGLGRSPRRHSQRRHRRRVRRDLRDPRRRDRARAPGRLRPRRQRA